MKRKVLALFLGIVTAAGVLAGCADGTATSNAKNASGDAAPADASAGSRVSEPGVYPIVDEKVELSVFMTQAPSVTDYEDNRLTEWMEEQTNVHINWQLTPTLDREQKLNLMLASNNLTDIIMGGVPSPILIDYADQGTFVALTDLIDTQAVHFQSVLEQNDGLRELITAPDGQIYTMPNVTIDLGNQFARRMWINKVWLDNLGLEIPTTTDELADVLRAFRDNDPNGNGQKDEIPMMGSTDGWQSSFDRFLLNSFTQYYDANPYRVENGEIKAAYDTEEYREGLRYLAMLVSEGLYDPASFTQDLATFKQIFENESAALIGALPSGGPTSFGTTGSARQIDYVPLSPLKGPNGVQLAAWDTYNNYTLYTNTFVVTSACVDPAIAVKWADLLYEAETAKRARWGVPGTDYVEADPNSVDSFGKPAKWNALLKWGSDQNSHWAGYNPTLEDFSGTAQKNTNDPTEYPVSNTTIAQEKYVPFAPPRENVMIPMMYDVETSSRMNEIKSILDPYIKQAREQFVTGSMNLDTDWDAYLAELEQMEYKTLVELMQTRYNELVG